MELSLAHRVGPAVEQAYARSDLLEQRRVLMDTWAEYLCGGLTYGKSYYGVFTFKGEHSKSELDAPVVTHSTRRMPTSCTTNQTSVALGMPMASTTVCQK